MTRDQLQKLCQELVHGIEDPKVLEEVNKAATDGIRRLQSEEGLRKKMVSIAGYEISRKKFYPNNRPAALVLGRKITAAELKLEK